MADAPPLNALDIARRATLRPITEVAAGMGIGEELLGGGQVAVQELGVIEGFGEGGLADAAHAGEPDDGGFAPATLDAFEPEWARDHADSIYVWSD